MFTVEQALKSVNSYFKLQNFIIENSYLFGDTAFKVILNLLSRVDYSLKNAISVMSFTELQTRTSKSVSALQKAIKELENKGLITKISGKYDKEFARYHRAILFQQPQKVLRSYNEINAYDLSGLLILAGLYYKLLELYEKELVIEFFYQVKRHYETTSKSLINMIAGAFYTAPDTPIGICLLGKSEGEIYLLGKSDIPNRQIRYTYIGKSDIPNRQKTISKDLNHTHTHTPHGEHDFEEEGQKEKITDGTEPPKVATPQLPNAYNPPDEIKDPPQSVDTQGQKKDKNSSSKPNPIQEIDEELKRFILDDLAKKEREGAIKSVNAILKSLTIDDIEIYRQKYEEFLKEKHMKEMKEKYKVCRIEMDIVKDKQKAISLFGDIFKTTDYEAIKNEIKKRKYKVVKSKIGKQYIFVLFEKVIAEYIYDRAIDMMLKVDIYEYAEYESFFKGG
jgi:DNA-binding MarR family transcriptional regulator/protein required for attachment to host cells